MARCAKLLTLLALLTQASAASAQEAPRADPFRVQILPAQGDGEGRRPLQFQIVEEAEKPAQGGLKAGAVNRFSFQVEPPRPGAPWGLQPSTAVGEGTINELRKLLQSNDAEVRKAATELIARLEKGKPAQAWALADDGSKTGFIRLRPADAAGAPGAGVRELIVYKDKDGKWVAQEMVGYRFEMKIGDLKDQGQAPQNLRAMMARMHALQETAQALQLQQQRAAEKNPPDVNKGPAGDIRAIRIGEAQAQTNPWLQRRPAPPEDRLHQLEESVARILRELQELRQQQGKR